MHATTQKMGRVYSCTSDNNLIRRILAGDKKALEKLLLRYKDWIYNIALRMVGNPADADDVTQEVIIKIITRLTTYKPSRVPSRRPLHRLCLSSRMAHL